MMERSEPAASDDDDGRPRHDSGTILLPLFPRDVPISVTLLFRMKRPKMHFVASRPGPGRIKPRYADHTLAASVRSDVDNLAKLVLDSLNGVLYDDDRQVVELRAMKVMDSEGCCVGATDVLVEGVGEREVEEFCARLSLPL